MTRTNDAGQDVIYAVAANLDFNLLMKMADIMTSGLTHLFGDNLTVTIERRTDNRDDVLWVRSFPDYSRQTLVDFWKYAWDILNEKEGRG